MDRNRGLAACVLLVILVNPALAAACFSVCDSSMRSVSPVAYHSVAHHYGHHGERATFGQRTCCAQSIGNGASCSGLTQAAPKGASLTISAASVDDSGLYSLPARATATLKSDTSPESPPLFARTTSVLRI